MSVFVLIAHLLSGYCLFNSLFTFCWNFFMSNSLNGLSSSRSPPDSLMMSLDKADSWGVKKETFKWGGQKGLWIVLDMSFVYLECVSRVDRRFWESLDQDIPHVVHLQFKTLKMWMHLGNCHHGCHRHHIPRAIYPQLETFETVLTGKAR